MPTKLKTLIICDTKQKAYFKQAKKKITADFITDESEFEKSGKDIYEKIIVFAELPWAGKNYSDFHGIDIACRLRLEKKATAPICILSFMSDGYFEKQKGVRKDVRYEILKDEGTKLVQLPAMLEDIEKRLIEQSRISQEQLIEICPKIFDIEGFAHGVQTDASLKDIREILQKLNPFDGINENSYIVCTEDQKLKKKLEYFDKICNTDIKFCDTSQVEEIKEEYGLLIEDNLGAIICYIAATKHTKAPKKWLICTCFSTASNAIKKLGFFAPMLIVLDFWLDESGPKNTQKIYDILKKTWGNSPVVGITRSEGDDSDLGAKKLEKKIRGNRDDVLQKNKYTFLDLPTKIRNAIDKGKSGSNTHKQKKIVSYSDKEISSNLSICIKENYFEKSHKSQSIIDKFIERHIKTASFEKDLSRIAVYLHNHPKLFKENFLVGEKSSNFDTWENFFFRVILGNNIVPKNNVPSIFIDIKTKKSHEKKYIEVEKELDKLFFD